MPKVSTARRWGRVRLIMAASPQPYAVAPRHPDTVLPPTPRAPPAVAVDEFVLVDLGLAGEPGSVLSVREAHEEQAVGFGRPVNEFTPPLHLPPLGASELNEAHTALPLWEAGSSRLIFRIRMLAVRLLPKICMRGLSLIEGRKAGAL